MFGHSKTPKNMNKKRGREGVTGVRKCQNAKLLGSRGHTLGSAFDNEI